MNFVKDKIEPLPPNYNTFPSQHTLTATHTHTHSVTTKERIALKISKTSFLTNPLLNDSLASIS